MSLAISVRKERFGKSLSGATQTETLLRSPVPLSDAGCGVVEPPADSYARLRSNSNLLIISV